MSELTPEQRLKMLDLLDDLDQMIKESEEAGLYDATLDLIMTEEDVDPDMPEPSSTDIMVKQEITEEEEES